MGTIWLSFQSSGKMPSCKDLLNNMVRDGAIWSAVSFSRRTWILWDPVALFISSCLIDVKTISTGISSSFSVGCEGVKGWLSADLWGGSEDRHKVRVEQLGDLSRRWCLRALLIIIARAHRFREGPHSILELKKGSKAFRLPREIWVERAEVNLTALTYSRYILRYINRIYI